MMFATIRSKLNWICSVLPTAAAVCRLLLLSAFCLLPSAAQAQQVVDKMVATVNGAGQTRCQVCLITYSDLLWQMALEPGTLLVNPSSEELNRTLSLIIDQRLILQEAEKLPSIAPTNEEIAAARDDLAKAFPSQAEFQSRLQSVGLTAEKLNEIIEQRGHSLIGRRQQEQERPAVVDVVFPRRER